MTNKKITVVGAGLAGTECALRLASLGFMVHLIEMRGKRQTPAHQTDDLAELVCSNSFGSLSEQSATGQLKWEAQNLGSFILAAARSAQVPAGQALAVDRKKMSEYLQDEIKKFPNLSLERSIVTSLENIPRPAVIATGPLTGDELASDLRNHFGDEFLYFFDAIAPIIDADSIDLNIAWRADRYDKGGPDYLNCPLEKVEYNNLIQEIIAAKKIQPKDFENTPFFESCMPIEEMVERGPQTLRFGPMKPVGLKNPRTGRDPWAVVQLRQENTQGTCYNMVGFQTRMTYSEQVRVFRMIPGLQNAEFLKLGSVHRNLYINTPACLNEDLSSRIDKDLFFAGQITGVEGYFESACIGLLVADFLAARLTNKTFCPPPRETALGSLWYSITDKLRTKHFQPTNINFGLMPGLVEKDKTIKRQKQIQNARDSFLYWKAQIG